MATTSMWPIYTSGSKGGRRPVKAVIKQLVEYAENEEKTKKNSDKNPEMKAPENLMRDPDKDESLMGASCSDKQDTMRNVVDYVSDKNEGMRYVTGINCTAAHATEEMLYTKKKWQEKGSRILWH